MRAARYYGKEDVRIEHDVPAPPQQLGEGQVRVKPAFVGICGTGMSATSSNSIDPAGSGCIARSITDMHSQTFTNTSLDPSTTHLFLPLP